MCRTPSSGQSLIPKEFKVAVKIWYLATSWNGALGGGCNKQKEQQTSVGPSGFSL